MYWFVIVVDLWGGVWCVELGSVWSYLYTLMVVNYLWFSSWLDAHNIQNKIDQLMERFAIAQGVFGHPHHPIVTMKGRHKPLNDNEALMTILWE